MSTLGNLKHLFLKRCPVCMHRVLPLYALMQSNPHRLVRCAHCQSAVYTSAWVEMISQAFLAIMGVLGLGVVLYVWMLSASFWLGIALVLIAIVIITLVLALVVARVLPVRVKP